MKNKLRCVIIRNSWWPSEQGALLESIRYYDKKNARRDFAASYRFHAGMAKALGRKGKMNRNIAEASERRKDESWHRMAEYLRTREAVP